MKIYRYYRKYAFGEVEDIIIKAYNKEEASEKIYKYKMKLSINPIVVCQSYLYEVKFDEDVFILR